MNEAQLTELVARGESDTLEFNESTAELQTAMETLCGMLNGSGGRVLIGVTNAGKISGQIVSDATLKELAQAYAQFEPPAAIRQQRVPLASGTEVLVIEVDPSGSGPHTFQGRAYRRLNSTTSVMPQPEYERRLLERDHATLRWENRVALGSPALDLAEVGLMLRDAVAANRLDSPITDPAQALERLKLVGPAGVTQAAVVAFALKPCPDYPQCALRMFRFKGITTAEFLDQRELTGHVFKLLQEAKLFLRRHLPVAGQFESGVLERIDEPLFPPLALWEALVNAFIHRDYSIVGGAVTVAVYDDRLEIISTGTLPFGLTAGDLLRDHQSRPRNPLLADLFFRRGLIEKWGRGTQKIIDLCVEAGHPSPEFEERAGDVVVRFIPRGHLTPRRIVHDLTERQRQILHALQDVRSLSISQIQATLKPEPTLPTLREDLIVLRGLSLVDGGGHGRGAVWYLKRTE